MKKSKSIFSLYFLWLFILFSQNSFGHENPFDRPIAGGSSSSAISELTGATDTEILFGASDGSATSSSALTVPDTTSQVMKILVSSTSITDPQLIIQQNGSGDATLRWTIGTNRSWVWGADNSDNDSFELDTAASANANLSTTSPPMRFSASSAEMSTAYTFIAGHTTDGAAGGKINAMSTSDFYSISAQRFSTTDATTPSIGFIKSPSATAGTYSGSLAVGEGLGRLEFAGYDTNVLRTGGRLDVVNEEFDSTYTTRPRVSFKFQTAQLDQGSSFSTVLYISTGGRLGVGLDNTAPEEALDVAGRFTVSGTTPTVSSCGTSPSISGSDTGGKVTIGSGASGTCTLTFSGGAYASAPACIVTNSDADVPVGATTSTTALTITDGAGDFSSDVVMYVCVGQDGD